MIFLSHTTKDKPIVEPIAVKLSTIFGKEKIFYDTWSIQPGEGIIDKMNEGLESCKFFFFFVSKNSLTSNMVKLEWQNALYKATQNRVKLIPVKLDDCLMPAILIQTLYIDIFGKGLEYGLRQIVDVINNSSSTNFFAERQTYENVRGYISYSQLLNSELHLEIKAETYVEPISKYIVLLEHEDNEVEGKCTNNVLLQQIFMKDVNASDHYKCNGIFFDILRPTTPGYPIKFVIKNILGQPIKFKGVMRSIGENSARNVPIVING